MLVPPNFHVLILFWYSFTIYQLAFLLIDLIFWAIILMYLLVREENCIVLNKVRCAKSIISCSSCGYSVSCMCDASGRSVPVGSEFESGFLNIISFLKKESSENLWELIFFGLLLVVQGLYFWKIEEFQWFLKMAPF